MGFRDKGEEMKPANVLPLKNDKTESVPEGTGTTGVCSDDKETMGNLQSVIGALSNCRRPQRRTHLIN